MPVPLRRSPTPLVLQTGGLVWRGGGEEVAAPAGLSVSSGIPALDAALQLGGLPIGGVTEIRSRPGLGGLSLAMAACVAALRRGAARCAVVDGSGTLHAPAVLEAGVRPGCLWCVQPRQPQDAALVALRLVRSGAFPVVVVDQSPAAPAQPELAVRRLSVAAGEGGTAVILLTGPWAFQVPLPMPAALRLQLQRSARHRLVVEVEKQRGAAAGAQVVLSWPLSVGRARQVPVVPVPASARRRASRPRRMGSPG
ncbi:MAG: hypothetical protein AB2A00_43595 [Myxococcota bacterium]